MFSKYDLQVQTASGTPLGRYAQTTTPESLENNIEAAIHR